MCPPPLLLAACLSACLLLILPLVTGGAGTLGLSAARALLEHGAAGLAIWDLEATINSSQPAIKSLIEQFPHQPVITVCVDVTSMASIATGIDAVTKVLGSVTHLFCFAGIVGCFNALDTTDERWRQTLDVNTTGAFLCAREVARRMTAQPTPRRCSITLTASISAHRVNYPQAQAAYNVSKAAVVALKSSLAAEWAVHGIRVNSISPGYMDTILNAGEGNIKDARESWTSRNPMGRMGALAEMDGVCVLLASRAGSYINGADLVVDGGASVF